MIEPIDPLKLTPYVELLSFDMEVIDGWVMKVIRSEYFLCLVDFIWFEHVIDCE